MFPCAPMSTPPDTISCALTPWVCTPKHPPLYTHVPVGLGWHGCAKGCCYPRQRLGCPSPATPHVVLAQGVSRTGASGFIGVTAQEEPQSSATAGREGEAVCQC